MPCWYKLRCGFTTSVWLYNIFCSFAPCHLQLRSTQPSQQAALSTRTLRSNTLPPTHDVPAAHHGLD